MLLTISCWIVLFLFTAALDKWINNTIDKRLVVLDIGTGLNTPGVVRWPAENLVEQHPSGSLIRINLNNSDIPKEIQSKSISIKGDVSEFMSGIFNRSEILNESIDRTGRYGRFC